MASRMLDRGELDERTHPDLKPPTFADLAEERAHRKARLAGACRIFAKFGYDHWVAGHITVRDPEKMKAYSLKAPKTLAPFGGKFLAMGKKAEVIGEPHRHQVIGIAEFPDTASIKAWHASDDYQALIPIRDEASEMHFVLYETISIEGWMEQEY